MVAAQNGKTGIAAGGRPERADRKLLFFDYGCCVPTSDFLWMVMVMFMFSVMVIFFCCCACTFVRWVYKRRMRKKCEALREKYRQEEKYKRENEIRLKRLGQRHYSHGPEVGGAKKVDTQVPPADIRKMVENEVAKAHKANSPSPEEHMETLKKLEVKNKELMVQQELLQQQQRQQIQQTTQPKQAIDSKVSEDRSSRRTKMSYDKLSSNTPDTPKLNAKSSSATTSVPPTTTLTVPSTDNGSTQTSGVVSNNTPSGMTIDSSAATQQDLVPITRETMMGTVHTITKYGQPVPMAEKPFDGVKLVNSGDVDKFSKKVSKEKETIGKGSKERPVESPGSMTPVGTGSTTNIRTSATEDRAEREAYPSRSTKNSIFPFYQHPGLGSESQNNTVATSGSGRSRNCPRENPSVARLKAQDSTMSAPWINSSNSTIIPPPGGLLKVKRKSTQPEKPNPMLTQLNSEGSPRAKSVYELRKEAEKQRASLNTDAAMKLIGPRAEDAGSERAKMIKRILEEDNEPTDNRNHSYLKKAQARKSYPLQLSQLPSSPEGTRK